MYSIYFSRISNRGTNRPINSGNRLLWWLSYGQEFGLSSPLVLDLGVIKLTFAIAFKINIASIIGVIISMFIYRRAV